VQLTVVWLVECESWGKLSEIKRESAFTTLMK